MCAYIQQWLRLAAKYQEQGLKPIIEGKEHQIAQHCLPPLVHHEVDQEISVSLSPSLSLSHTHTDTSVYTHTHTHTHTELLLQYIGTAQPGTHVPV